MLFNSPEFLLGFLPVTLVAFFAAARLKRGRTLVLLVASWAFYAAWSVAYLPLLILSTAGNFLVGMQLIRRRSRLLLGLAVAANLLLLGWYKYTGFGVEALGDLLGRDLPALHVILPIGISFYTFTQIAFLVDAWRGRVVDRDPIRYALFVSFFPHLIAGPILHHEEMTRQFRAYPRVSGADVATGVTLFVMGFAKKVALADSLAPFVSAGFDNPASAVAAWTSALGYALQLYFDFSGYSDMAIGLACLFGLRLPENFRSPYKSRSIAEFWTRWHMTLSRFLRDYLYVPLGGNRKGRLRSHVNAFATMLLGGIWHGAGWGFVLWGAMHGAFLVIGRLWNGWAEPRGIRLGIIAPALTFLCVVLAWVPFRAESLEGAWAMYQAMAGLNGLGAPVKTPTVLIAVGLAIVWLAPNSQQLLARHHPVLEDARHPLEPAKLEWRFTPAYGLALGCAFAFSLIVANDVSEFLYFQF